MKNLRRYFTLSFIRSGFFNSLLISNFIIVEIFENLFLDFVSPFLAIYGLYRLIFADKPIWFFTGFFIGFFWFYWISFSLIYYDFAFLIPAEIFGISLIYGLILLICGIFKNPFLRIFFLILTTFIHPFGFNWFNLNLILIPGIFDPNLRGLICIFIAILSFKFIKNLKFLAIIPLIFALQFYENKPNFIPFDTKLENTKIAQSIKWNKAKREEIILEIFAKINNAISEKKEIIIFPENAIPIILNNEENIIDFLKNFSYKISIVVGSLSYEDGNFQNSLYIFENGEMKRFDKSFLVPFGEEIPLPNFARNFINKIFFNSNQDFKSSHKINDFFIKNIKIRGAICYEVTKKEIYQNSPKIIIAITNNAWFVPSTEPFLQRSLIKYFATLYKTTIYHSVNGSKSEIITPKKLWIKKLINRFYN